MEIDNAQVLSHVLLLFLNSIKSELWKLTTRRFYDKFIIVSVRDAWAMDSVQGAQQSRTTKRDSPEIALTGGSGRKHGSDYGIA